jgi:pimeloyl-ACP methyl ester carboxylesterase
MVWGALTPPLAPPLIDPAIALKVIPDAGHVMMTENPAAFADVVADAVTTDR